MIWRSWARSSTSVLSRTWTNNTFCGKKSGTRCISFATELWLARSHYGFYGTVMFMAITSLCGTREAVMFYGCQYICYMRHIQMITFLSDKISLLAHREFVDYMTIVFCTVVQMVTYKWWPEIALTSTGCDSSWYSYVCNFISQDKIWQHLQSFRLSLQPSSVWLNLHVICMSVKLNSLEISHYWNRTSSPG